MCSTQHEVDSKDGPAKESNITESTKRSSGVVLEDDSTAIEDEDLIQDQELIDSYEFVEADYHLYSDVASSVTLGSSTDSELSDCQDKIVAASKDDFFIKDGVNGDAKEGHFIQTTRKKADDSDDKNNHGEMVENTK